MDNKIIIVLVGLPARGKSFTSNNLSRFLNWYGLNCKVFNSGEYRRKLLSGFQDSDFFNDNNFEKRDKISKLCLSELIFWLKNNGNIGIFDATNTNRSRREDIVKIANNNNINNIIFVELITDDEKIINNNLQLKLKSPDYIDKDPIFALKDFKERLEHYMKIYETIDDNENINYIKIINFTDKLLIKNVVGVNESLIISYLMNLRLNKFPIYITRHGESINNINSIIGGDPSLTKEGQFYAKKLTNFIESEVNDDFIIFTSCLKRTIETAEHFKNKNKIQTRLLNEIHAGICENMSINEIKDKFPNILSERNRNKLKYRYPEGESYLDLIERLRYFILQLESYEKPILIIAHNAVVKVLIGYFINLSHEDIPYQEIELGKVIKFVPNSKKYNMEIIDLLESSLFKQKTL